MREFKGDLRAPLPLHPMEKAVLWIAILQICSLPWMLGGMRPWAQFIALGLSIVAFVIALVPRRYAGNYIRNESFTLYPHRKLIRWPIFWIGLVFFAYVLIQALNPAFEFVQFPNSWGMVQIPHIEWLPSGMRTPFAMMNTWRQMMIWGAPSLLACAVWIGFTRRKSIVTLLSSVAINASILAALGILARATGGNSKILWVLDSPVWYQFSSFIYKNHAGSFFALTTGICLALAVYHHGKASRYQRKSSPSGLFVFLALANCIAVLQSYSRAAILILGVFLTIFTITSTSNLIIKGTITRIPVIISIFIIGAIGFGFIGSKLINSDKTIDRIQALTDGKTTDYSVLSRQLAWKAGFEMASEKPLTGWGAGGFRFLFPRYQVQYPEITTSPWDRKKRFNFWEHAHNDYLQLLIEAGKIGTLIIVTGFIAAIAGYIRIRGFKHHTSLALLFALSITLVHAATDFPLQNPAILTTCIVTITIALAFPRLEILAK